MRRIVSIIIALVIIAGLAAYWYDEHNNEQGAYVQERAAVPVTVTKVSRQVVPNQVVAVGTLQALRQVDLAPQIAGKVASISYTPGSYVKQGKVLIQLDDRIYKAQLKSAESTLKLTQLQYQRLSELVKSGAASQRAHDQARADYQQAKSSVATNKAYLNEMQIAAPFAGYVGPKNVSVGDYVQKGEEITTLTDRSQLLVDYQLSERYLSKLKLGQLVSIVIPAHAKNKVQGQVTYISPIIDKVTHSVSMQATIPNKDNLLAPGLFVKVHQTTRVNRHALVVPQASIVPTITGPKVFIIKNNKANLVAIKTGATFNNLIEVRQGLSLDDEVVIAGQQRLQDGVLVKEVSA